MLQALVLYWRQHQVTGCQRRQYLQVHDAFFHALEIVEQDDSLGMHQVAYQRQVFGLQAAIEGQQIRLHASLHEAGIHLCRCLPGVRVYAYRADGCRQRAGVVLVDGVQVPFRAVVPAGAQRQRCRRLAEERAQFNRDLRLEGVRHHEQEHAGRQRDAAGVVAHAAAVRFEFAES
ncbi:MAG TPA: hypothetical protein VGD18_03990, partial [Thiobacillaceae bacterium]